MTKHLQLSEQGRLKHFLTIEGLSTELLTEILDTAESFVDMSEHRVRKVPLLRGKTIINLFLKTAPVPEPHLNSLPPAYQRTC